jgi:protoporphyrinogen oxidase
MLMANRPVVIIGAGLAGLACATRLQKKGIPFLLLEASSVVGGRVQTEVEDGFRLDRGFQVLLTAYPQTAQILNKKSLQLRNFRSGAVIRSGNKFHAVADPTRHPTMMLRSLLSPVATVADKWRVVRLRNRLCWTPLKELLGRPEMTTAQRLQEAGFSEKLVRGFFQPFLAGIFLETEMVTSSRKFDFVMRMFSLGRGALPALGMQAIPRQLADRLTPGTLQLNAPVASINRNCVQLAGGDCIEAQKVVIATNQREAMQLLGRTVENQIATVTCLYYAAPKSPVKGPWLVLNGEGSGPINNLCVPSEVQRSYAPKKKALVSVTVVSADYQHRSDLESLVRSHLTSWYGSGVAQWRHLRTFRIEQAFALQEPPQLTPVEKPIAISDRIFLCGDYTGIASIEGAIASGFRAADAVSA